MRRMAVTALWILCLALAGDLALPGATAARDEPEATTTGQTPDRYDVRFDVGLKPSEKSAHVSITLGDGAEAVEWLRLTLDPLRYRSIKAEGKLEEVEGGVRWFPPAEGGTLRYVFSIDHLRDDNSYDSRCAKNWAIFRGQDLVPRLRIRTTPGAKSNSTMRLRLPEGWSAAVPYPSSRGGRYSLDNPRTRFDRPSGWFAFGKLGVMRETLEGTRIAIAGPAGQGVRRMDTLAMLKWTMPALREVFGDLPKRFQVVIAGDPMWRGGLSGPRSVYLHVDRPLITSDATSPLLHEIVHSFMHARSGKGGQWIVEGLAEYYSIALLRRSETLTAERYESAMDSIRRRAAPVSARLDGDMNTALRARSVLILMDVDQLIRDASGGAAGLDELVRKLVEFDRPITLEVLQEAVAEVAGRDFPDFFARLAARLG